MSKDGRYPGGKLPPQLLREARMRQRDGEWLSSAKTLILRRYRGKYVAIRNKKILAASTTMKGLYAKLDKLNPGMVLITRIERPTLLVYVELR
ncbi:hypothetical protein AUI06_07440 [archaeon 13_2_20CM_2_52_21]|nr:MAG: hypothetical protein AUI06_07440 [archaeon 13_2_20CM_2_52_21]